MEFKNKYAFHTASNYDGTVNKLNGCINDWKNVLENIDGPLGIPEENRQSFIGPDYRRDIVVPAAHKLPELVKAGDLLIYTNSSHGTQTPDHDGDEEDGEDEAIYTDDGNLITDDEIHALMTRFVPGCLVIGLFDNCHAGTLDRGIVQRNWHYMPDDVKCNAVFFTGCKDPGTSADAYIPGFGYNGAMTYYLIESLKENDYQITYLDLLEDLNARLRKHRYQQVEQMACTRNIMNKGWGEM